MGSKQTNLKDLSLGGAIAVLICGVIGYYEPELLDAIPGAEAALTVIITATFAYLKEPKQ